MELQTATFTRKVSFDRYCNEAYIVTARVEPDDDPDEVMDDLSKVVGNALERSKVDRLNDKAIRQAYE